MKNVKLVGALILCAGIATSAAAAEVPASLHQLDNFVNTVHPLSVSLIDGPDGSVDYTYVRNQAAAAYTAGNFKEGCRLEAFARHLVGATPAASCANAVASSEY